MEKILVIKLGALGDFVQAMGAFQAIRQHHKTAQITLMTTPPFKQMGKDCGYFDEVWVDSRRPFYNISTLMKLRKGFRGGRFNRIYDLQCVARTNLYFKYLLPSPKPQWSGLAPGCSHPHTDIGRSQLHTYDRHRQQLKLAGIREVPDPELDWVCGDVSKFDLPPSYFLLIPGAAPGGSRKQWPAKGYGEVALGLYERGITPVIIGTKLEQTPAAIIRSFCPEAIDLTGKTDLYDIVALAREATGALGNDTGPTHMVAQSGCPLLVLFSSHSDPNRFGPRGDNVEILQNDDLKALKSQDVWECLRFRGEQGVAV